MTDDEYEVVMTGCEPVVDNRILKGRDLFYRCLKCNTILASTPKKSGGCACGNIFMDLDAFRLSIADETSIAVLRRIGSSG